MKAGSIAVVVAAVALSLTCVACAIGGAIYGNSPSSATSANPTPDAVKPSVTQTASPRGKVPPKPAGIGTGEWRVGVDVSPGRYQSNGPDGDFMCYWQLTTEPGARPGDPAFLTNDVPPGHAYIDLKAGQYFSTSHCQPWTLTT